MKFSNYLKLRESKETNFITSKIKLQKELGSKEFTPFTVNKNSHSNLRPVIKAFVNSNQVGLGYTTIDKTKGEIEPQLKKKNLYLTGGAVRDHLKNKTPKNYDLVTDATISEIRMILDQSEENFTEVKPNDIRFKNDLRYKNLPTFSRNKKFYVSRWDKKGKELEITVEIKNDKYFISPLTKAYKSRLVEPEESEAASSIEEDSRNRDFTINSLYIPLNTADGDNSDLIDPYGGATHLKNNQVKFVGDEADKRLEEDPMTALRYLNINSRYGQENIPEDYKSIIKKYIKSISAPKDVVKKEFISGVENPDVNPKFYILFAKDLDILSLLFPGLEVSTEDIPENFIGDRWLSTAWVLKNNTTDKIKNVLSSNGWTDTESNDICYLIDFYKWANNNFDPNNFYDMKNRHRSVSNSKFKDWAKLSNINNYNFDQFLNYDDSQFKPYILDGDKKVINPEFSKILGRNPIGGEFENIKRNLLINKWKNIISKQI